MDATTFPLSQQVLSEWAKNCVATLNNNQRELLLKPLFNDHQRKMNELLEERLKKENEERAKRLEKQQQQAILDLLNSQIPTTVDVLRHSTSPDSQPSCSSSNAGDIEENQPTIKEFLMGKCKKSFRQSPHYKPYRSRLPRERVFFDGFLYVFDKLSNDGKKKFFRCEKKNTCTARLHTQFDSGRIIQRWKTHNHPAPSASDLAAYEIDYGKIRSDYTLPVTKTQQRYRNMVPQALPTPKSAEGGNNISLKVEDAKSATPMEVLAEMAEKLERRETVTEPLPKQFKHFTDKENNEMDTDFTENFQKHNQVINAMMKGDLEMPIFISEAKERELFLFIADCNEDNENASIFQMVKVEERSEESIRQAIQKLLQKESNRMLMVSVSSKINIPLKQEMIDQWKTEEFIRLDHSKPNYWKIHQVRKIDD